MRPRLLPWTERWRPQELGRSLPVAPGLRVWALGFAAVALVALVGLLLAVRALGTPAAEPAAGAAVAEAALDRLARAELPVWDPGAELPAVEAPEYLPPPAPPLATEAHPGDPWIADRSEVLAAARRIEATPAPPVEAVTVLTRAAEEERGAWLLAYDAGVALLRSGFDDRAAGFLTRAQRTIERRDGPFVRRPEHHAAATATRYAAGHANLAADCVDAIHHFKLAVGALDRYVASGGADVFDRKLPFALAPLDLGSLDVWMALAWGYTECEGRYPAEYVERVPRARGFLESEYRNPEHPEIVGGPFPRQLARCVEEGGTSSRCWALSNLNRLWAVNRHLALGGDLDPAYAPHREALARLAYDVAFLAAAEPEPEEGDAESAFGAGEVLRAAHRLARPLDRAEHEALRSAIERLGRHLAVEAKDFTLLAEEYRGRPPSEMPFAADAGPEAVKGMAWALRERWQGHLAARRPDRVFEEVETVRQRVPDVHLDSLAAWEGEAREALRDALAAEIRDQKRRGNLALAAGLRDFRAPWLGEAWAERADAAWWTPGLTAAKWGLVVLYVLFLAGLVVAYRAVVYPYLVYTADFYKSEMERRVEERRAKNLPVTGDEIYRWRQERAGRDV